MQELTFKQALTLAQLIDKTIPEHGKDMSYGFVSSMSREAMVVEEICRAEYGYSGMLRKLFDDIFAAMDFLEVKDSETGPMTLRGHLRGCVIHAVKQSFGANAVDRMTSTSDFAETQSFRNKILSSYMHNCRIDAHGVWLVWFLGTTLIDDEIAEMLAASIRGVTYVKSQGHKKRTPSNPVFV